MNSLKFKLFVLAIFVVAAFAMTDDEEWQAYKNAHGKKMKDAREEALRKANFLKTNRLIKEHNAKGASFRMAHNEFSDWTDEEKKILAGKKALEPIPTEADPALELSERQLLPAALDYRNDSCMPAIKNQGSCGSCWAFSTVATLEFLVCKNGQKTSLSEQQLVDCACSGCNGGDYYPAWYYLNNATTSGAVSAAGYSYTGVEGTCKSATSGLIKPMSWNRIQYNTTTIMNALKTYGVLAIAMDVQNSFMSYSSGIYQGTDCSNAYSALNHAMALVGYGKDTASGLNFWVVRNSWGTAWGENGYIRVRRGTNVCGVETDVGYVKTNLAVTL